MKLIWKYRIGSLANLARTHHTMPQGARILHVDSQEETVYIWAEFDHYEPTEERCFGIHGTGSFIPQEAQYVGTTQIPPFVWHVYEHPGCKKEGLNNQQHLAS